MVRELDSLIDGRNLFQICLGRVDKWPVLTTLKQFGTVELSAQWNLEVAVWTKVTLKLLCTIWNYTYRCDPSRNISIGRHILLFFLINPSQLSGVRGSSSTHVAFLLTLTQDYVPWWWAYIVNSLYINQCSELGRCCFLWMVHTCNNTTNLVSML